MRSCRESVLQTALEKRLKHALGKAGAREYPSLARRELRTVRWVMISGEGQRPPHTPVVHFTETPWVATMSLNPQSPTHLPVVLEVGNRLVDPVQQRWWPLDHVPWEQRAPISDGGRHLTSNQRRLSSTASPARHVLGRRGPARLRWTRSARTSASPGRAPIDETSRTPSTSIPSSTCTAAASGRSYRSPSTASAGPGSARRSCASPCRRGRPTRPRHRRRRMRPRSSTRSRRPCAGASA